MVPQLLSYFIMPIGEKAVTPPVPDAKYKPRKCSEQQKNKIQLSCFRKYPPESIDQNNNAMKEEEKIIEQVQHGVKIKKRNSSSGF